MAFQPSAQMSALDLSALAGVTPEQLAIIARAMQSGALPFPPAPPPALHSSTSSRSNGVASGPHTSSISGATDGASFQQISQNSMNGDHKGDEDGEVMESGSSYVDGYIGGQMVGGEGTTHTNTERNVRGRNKRRARIHPDTAAKSIDSAAQVARGELVRTRAPVQQSQGGIVKSKSQSHPTQEMRTSLKNFIGAMLGVGYTQTQLAAQVSDPEALRRLMLSLDLDKASSSLPTGSVSAADDLSKPLPVKKPAPTKSSTSQNRSEYLAKLQALKDKKSQSSPKPTNNTSSVVAQQPVTTDSQAAPASKPSPSAKAAKDKLLREKLEALKAAKAPKKAQVNTGKPPQGLGSGIAEAANIFAEHYGLREVPPPPSVAVPAFGQIISPPPLANTKSVVTNQAVNPLSVQRPTAAGTPTAPSPSSTPILGGLPGLFMTNNQFGRSASAVQTPPMNLPSQAKPLPAASPATPTLEQSVKLSTDITHSLPTSVRSAESNSSTHLPLQSAIPQGKPFGKRPAVDEPMIIEISEDDDEGEDMDISNSDDEGPHATSINASSNGGVLVNGAIRPILQRASTSSSTIAQSPVTVGKQDAYAKKLQQLELLKRQLAERELKKRAKSDNKVGGDASANGSSSGIATPIASSATLPGLVQVSTPAPPNQGLVPTAIATTSSNMKQDKEYWRRRHDELKQQLSRQGLQGNVEPTIKIPVNATEATVHDLATNGSSIVVSQTMPAAALAQVNTVDDNGTPRDDQKPSDDEASLDAQSSAIVNDEQLIQKSLNAADDNARGSEDDLDDVYDPPSSAATSPQIPSGTQAATLSPGTAAGLIQDPALAARSENDDDDSDSAMDTSVDSDSDSDSDESLEDAYEPELQQAVHIETGVQRQSQQRDSVHTVPDAQANIATEVAVLSDGTNGELILPQQEELVAALEVKPTASKPHYVPYESPLSNFKDYRFHDDYLNAVPGGYKSLTYNHQIDPMKELCPFEAGGGVCNDTECVYQHFRSMPLADHVLLRSLSTNHSPAKNPEDEKRWKAGLGELIKELKTTNLGKQDVGIIAQRIAQYRREFIADPTSTLQLD